MSSRRDAGALIRSMLTLGGECKTGVLRVDADGVRTFVYLLDGTPVFAEEEAGETLGRLLVRQKVLTQEQCNAILLRMTEKLGGNELLRFGEVAVELGILTGDQVQRALTEQTRSKLTNMFQREDPEWHFAEGRGALEDVGRFPMQVEAISLLAARALPADRRAAILDAAARRFLALGTDPPTVARRFELTAVEEAWVARIDGHTAVADLAAASPPPSVDSHAVLVALLLTRVGTLAERAQAAPRPVVAQPTTALPSGVVASSGRIQAVSGIGVEEDGKKRAERLLSALGRRRLVGDKTTAAGAPKSSNDARLNAELAFQRGKSHLRHERFKPALEDFRQASELDAEREEYQLFLRWTEAVARPQPPGEAERIVLKRLGIGLSRRDPTLAIAPYVMGRVAAWENNELEAAKWLERAVALDPTLGEAKQELGSSVGAPRKVLWSGVGAALAVALIGGWCVMNFTKGLVHLPASAGAYRVFVDGKNVESSSGAISVACGSRSIHTGGPGGKDQKVEVPCGGEVTLE